MCLLAGCGEEQDEFDQLIEAEETAATLFCAKADACYGAGSAELCQVPFDTQPLVAYRNPLSARLLLCLREVHRLHAVSLAQESRCFTRLLNSVTACIASCTTEMEDCEGSLEEFEACSAELPEDFKEARDACLDNA